MSSHVPLQVKPGTGPSIQKAILSGGGGGGLTVRIVVPETVVPFAVAITVVCPAEAGVAVPPEVTVPVDADQSTPCGQVPVPLQNTFAVQELVCPRVMVFGEQVVLTEVTFTGCGGGGLLFPLPLHPVKITTEQISSVRAAARAQVKTSLFVFIEILLYSVFRAYPKTYFTTK